jgi:hypothetical protein
MTDESTSEFKGESSAKLAKTALETYIDDGSLQVIKVEVTTSTSDAEIRSTVSRSEDSNSVVDGTSPDTEVPSMSEENEQEKPDEEREASKIGPNTSHHRVLHTLDRLDDGGAVPGREVKKHVTGVNKKAFIPQSPKFGKGNSLIVSALKMLIIPITSTQLVNTERQCSKKLVSLIRRRISECTAWRRGTQLNFISDIRAAACAMFVAQSCGAVPDIFVSVWNLHLNWMW